MKPPKRRPKVGKNIAKQRATTSGKYKGKEQTVESSRKDFLNEARDKTLNEGKRDSKGPQGRRRVRLKRDRKQRPEEKMGHGRKTRVTPPKDSKSGRRAKPRRMRVDRENRDLRASKKAPISRTAESVKAKSKLPQWMQNHFDKNASGRIKVAASIGGAVGLGYALADRQDDNVASTGEKMVKYATLGVAADYGTEIGAKVMGLHPTLKTSHIAKDDVRKNFAQVRTKVDEMRWQRNAASKLGVAARIGLTAFGVATALDIGKDLKESREATIQKNNQEQEVLKQMAAERKRQRQNAYGYTDYGQVVLEQWQKRIGHYAMGNAKFY